MERVGRLPSKLNIAPDFGHHFYRQPRNASLVTREEVSTLVPLAQAAHSAARLARSLLQVVPGWAVRGAACRRAASTPKIK
ncbi:hypothetical protein E2C01_035948 [Portunus trituberculatus]|uniref:Uncharacterized protein n=1 Tax=Portunus trituberculatus TaxID=210409 RepID=A0A5B7FAN8_PORTR|nr:hypothetical protein [Portunus trituberculatus]